LLDTVQDWVLTANDRCDASCSAQAFVMVKGVSGELLFCSHHFNKILSTDGGKSKLEDFAFEIIDERAKLIEDRLKD